MMATITLAKTSQTMEQNLDWQQKQTPQLSWEPSFRAVFGQSLGLTHQKSLIIKRSIFPLPVINFLKSFFFSHSFSLLFPT